MDVRKGRFSLLVSGSALASLLLTGCAKPILDCTAFGKEFDRLQGAAATAAAAIANRGVCHTQVEADRRSQCPEYYVWLTAAKTFAAFVASEKAGCVQDPDKQNARLDFIDLQKPDAFPVK
ncbi:MAG TPA: hypothetical protein VMV52_08135 [Candidatus Nanopelagicaceae bacterium]|nr:hypothetical protein [Candidatus Nanopelagicaceae bacterium]